MEILKNFHLHLPVKMELVLRGLLFAIGYIQNKIFQLG